MDHETVLKRLVPHLVGSSSSGNSCLDQSCPKSSCEKHTTADEVGDHRSSGAAAVAMEQTAVKRKAYQCTVCEKSFAQSISLKRHIRTHTGEKPFQCAVCMRRFTNSSHLTTHMRTHTGERPFQCDMCGKKFSQHSGLHVHIRTHTGDKPYKCDICGKGFLDRSALKRHGSTHLAERPAMSKTKRTMAGGGGGGGKRRRTGGGGGSGVISSGAAAATGGLHDNLPTALICIKTLQDLLATKAACLSAPGRLNYLLHRSLLHNLSLSIQQAAGTVTPPGLLSPPSSQHGLLSPPSSLLSPPTTPGEVKISSSPAPAFICSVTNVRSLANDVKIEKDL